jgi:hypothetical protein
MHQVETWLIIDQQTLAHGSNATGPSRVTTRGPNRSQARRAISEWVVARVLERPDVARLPIVHRQVEPRTWLQDQLQVEPWGASDLVRIRLAGSDPDQLTVILKAVAESYFAGSGGVSHEQRTAADVGP